MSRRIDLPKIDSRTASDLLNELHQLIRHYTPEWPAKDEDDPGRALLSIFSFIAEGVVHRLNRAPERNLLAFLDMLGIRQLPKRPAAVPLRFIVAPGTTDVFRIPKGAQATASPGEGQSEPVSFESQEELLAIPSKLASLIAVDPQQDAIFKPPPGFRELSLAASPLPPLLTLAYSAAGSRYLQVNLPGQVKPGDFLRIDFSNDGDSTYAGCPPLITGIERVSDEYVVVEDIQGAIISLTRPLLRECPEGTLVHKLTQFELFAGQNFQEHLLYLAHNKLFNLKGESRVEISVRHAPGATVNRQPLDVAWEFYTENDETKEGVWQSFGVVSDQTLGLSQDGSLILFKPSGEINERQIGGFKNRWIRGRLVDGITENIRHSLPNVESLRLNVLSKQGGVTPDRIFYNDTPLTLQPRFNPFGFEPRLFDRFYVASDEAFSKPNATIKIHVKTHISYKLGAPVVVFQQNSNTNRDILRVFARGFTGQLVEFQIDPTTNNNIKVINYQNQTGMQIAQGSTPAALSLNEIYIVLYARVDDDGSPGKSNIYASYISDTPSAKLVWVNLKTKSGKIEYNLAAIAIGNDRFLYAVIDNNVHCCKNENANDWTQLGDYSKNNSPYVASTPAVFTVKQEGKVQVQVVVCDNNGRTWIYDDENNWQDITPKVDGSIDPSYLCWQPSPDKDELIVPRPHVIAYADRRNANNSAHAIIIIRNKDNNLVVFDSKGNVIKPPTNEITKNQDQIFSNPYGVGTAERPRVFARGDNETILEFCQDDEKWKTQSYSTPSSITITNDPFILEFRSKSDYCSLFSSCNQNALIEFRTMGSTGQFRAGPHDILILEQAIDYEQDEYYVDIPRENDTSQIFKIVSTQSKDNVAVLESSLSSPASAGMKYKIFQQVKYNETLSLESQPTDNNKVVIKISNGQIDSSTLIGKYILYPIVNKSPTNKSLLYRIIDAYELVTNVTVALERQIEIDSEDNQALLLALMHENHPEQTAQAGSNVHALLADSASPIDQFYHNQIVEYKSTDSQVFRSAVDVYTGSTRGIRFQSSEVDNFSQPNIHPTKGQYYRVGTLELPNLWFVHLDPDLTEIRPELSWEYWNGSGWMILQVKDNTGNLLESGEVEFKLPHDMTKTEVIGQDNYWIRVRLVGGDYGRELYSVIKPQGGSEKLQINKNPLRPPVIANLSISYEYKEFQDPQSCLTYNNLTYFDQTAANITVDKNYQPFLATPDERKALYIGFDRGVEGGPVRVYFAAEELPVEERNKPKLNWTFTTSNGWQPLSSEDKTDGLTKPEFVTWVVPPGFQQRGLYGDELYWVRGELAEGTDWRDDNYPLLSGVFPNTVRTIQARTILNEILGSSRGIANQKFRFAQRPVLEGEEVRVREALTQQLRDELLEAEGEDSILDIVDQQGRVQETWVRWKEVREFFDSRPDSRHYRLDRASGEIEFGDNKRGLIPPAGGDNIRAFVYQTGGGAQGNVPAGAISSAVTAIAGLESVINPVPAGGGSEEATVEAIKDIGAAQISHRGRAVTPEDYERLAQEASREVRKVLCLPNRNNLGLIETGWVTVLIAPDSTAAEPEPSLELRNAVKRYLAERGDATVVAQNHIFVGAPSYAAVSVHVTVRARSFDVAGMAEAKVQQQLAKFLHPLSGGLDGNGWDFGRGLTASDLYTLIEDIDEVDHVVELNMYLRKGSSERLVEGEQVIVDENALLTGGTHRVSILVDNGA